MIDEKKLLEKLEELKFANEQKGYDTAKDIIQEIINLVNEQPKADWIPCEVELPKENTEVWVTVEELDGDCYTQSSWLQEGQWVVKKTPLNPKVIAWMPKPRPYKKEGAENE